mgnify:CR=1 FL=1
MWTAGGTLCCSWNETLGVCRPLMDKGCGEPGWLGIEPLPVPRKELGNPEKMNRRPPASRNASRLFSKTTEKGKVFRARVRARRSPHSGGA